jgi:hypothetical protein
MLLATISGGYINIEVLLSILTHCDYSEHLPSPPSSRQTTATATPGVVWLGRVFVISRSLQPELSNADTKGSEPGMFSAVRLADCAGVNSSLTGLSDFTERPASPPELLANI